MAASKLPSITFRADGPTQKALEFLERAGTPRSTVLREAVIALYRAKLEDQLRADFERLASDPAYLAEVAELAAEDAAWDDHVSRLDDQGGARVAR